MSSRKGSPTKVFLFFDYFDHRYAYLYLNNSITLLLSQSNIQIEIFFKVNVSIFEKFKIRWVWWFIIFIPIKPFLIPGMLD